MTADEGVRRPTVNAHRRRQAGQARVGLVNACDGEIVPTDGRATAHDPDGLCNVSVGWWRAPSNRSP